MRVGTIALGYADGYLRCWSGKGAMLHEGRRLPVLGRVSMDMTVIDLANAPDLKEGDWVKAEYSLPEAAATSGLSQYELLTSLGRRFARQA
jgi:alanine racemase